MGADGAGTGVLGNQAQQHGPDLCFLPQMGHSSPRLIPAGAPVPCSYHLPLAGHYAPASPHPRPQPGFFLNQETPQRVPALTAPWVEWPGLVSYQLNPGRLGDPLSLTSNRKHRSVWREGPETQWVGTSWKWAHDNEAGGDLCLGHLQVPAED